MALATCSLLCGANVPRLLEQKRADAGVAGVLKTGSSSLKKVSVRLGGGHADVVEKRVGAVGVREISGSGWAMASARWRARLGSRLGVQSSRRAVLLTRRGLSHDSEAAGQLLSIPLPTSKSRAAEELQPPRCELAMSSEMKPSAPSRDPTYPIEVSGRSSRANRGGEAGTPGAPI